MATTTTTTGPTRNPLPGWPRKARAVLEGTPRSGCCPRLPPCLEKVIRSRSAKGLLRANLYGYGVRSPTLNPRLLIPCPCFDPRVSFCLGFLALLVVGAACASQDFSGLATVPLFGIQPCRARHSYLSPGPSTCPPSKALPFSPKAAHDQVGGCVVSNRGVEPTDSAVRSFRALFPSTTCQYRVRQLYQPDTAQSCDSSSSAPLPPWPT
jgi:hypothetical protein